MGSEGAGSGGQDHRPKTSIRILFSAEKKAGDLKSLEVHQNNARQGGS